MFVKIYLLICNNLYIWWFQCYHDLCIFHMFLFDLKERFMENGIRSIYSKIHVSSIHSLKTWQQSNLRFTH
jgi:hypothetical protein